MVFFFPHHCLESTKRHSACNVYSRININRIKGEVAHEEDISQQTRNGFEGNLQNQKIIIDVIDLTLREQ